MTERREAGAGRAREDEGAPPGLLEELGRRKRWARGETLFLAGEPASGFHWVRSGEVRVTQADGSGREVEVARFGPGEFVGEAVAFAGVAYPASAEAARESETLRFDVAEVLRRVGRDPEAARFFLRLLARKCLVLNRRVQSLGLQTVRRRLAGFLAGRCGGRGACEVRLDLRKADLARMIGTTGETLSRTLRKLSEEGVIAVAGRTIRILDCERLRGED